MGAVANPPRDPTLPSRPYWLETVRWFRGRMVQKLRANDHKRGWEDDGYEDLLLRLREETAELARAIRKNRPPATIIKEAADVANFAMMIADNARRENE